MKLKYKFIEVNEPVGNPASEGKRSEMPADYVH